MPTHWLPILIPALIQFAMFLRWLHRRVRDDEIQRVFVRDVATNHLPHLYDALRRIANHMLIDLPDPPPLRFIDPSQISDKNSHL